MKIRHAVVTSLGAAAGGLAATAFVSAAPIASADDTNTIDYAGLSSAAASYPELTFSSGFDIYLGNAEYAYVTTYDGSGMPTTTMETNILPTGDLEYGTASSFEAEFYPDATGTYYLDEVGSSSVFGNAFDDFYPISIYFEPVAQSLDLPSAF